MAYIQLQSTWDTVCISCKDQKDTPSWFFRLNWVHTTKPSEFRTVPNNTGFDPLPGQLPLLSRHGSNIRLSWKHYRLMNCFGMSPTAQTFSTPDRPNMNQRFCEMQALSHSGRQRHKLNWANSRCFTFVETGAEILQTQSQLWSCSLLGTGKDYLVPNMLLGKLGNGGLNRNIRHAEEMQCAHWPTRPRVSAGSREKSTQEPVPLPSAVQNHPAESLPPCSRAQWALVDSLPHRSQNIILTPLCPSVVCQAAKSPGLGGIPLTANSFLGRNGISGPYRDPNCKQAGKIALLTTYLEYYLLRSNYRKSKQKLCKSTSSPEMMEGDGSSFQHGKWKLSIWTFSKP